MHNKICIGQVSCLLVRRTHYNNNRKTFILRSEKLLIHEQFTIDIHSIYRISIIYLQQLRIGCGTR